VKAAKADAVRTGGAGFANPIFLGEGMALRSGLESTGTEFNYENSGGACVRLRKSKRGEVLPYSVGNQRASNVA